jgi:Bifunctional DNA primase/polymerase, N-terminal
MVEVVARRGRRKVRERIAAAAVRYADMGWPVCLGAHPTDSFGRACSCDRVGCPDPGAHPVSPAWQLQATVDGAAISRWWRARPDANLLLVTGRVFDVLDVPAAAGRAAVDHLDVAGVCGPVAACGPDRCLFFTVTRGAPADEDEWWSCNLDCVPGGVDETPGLRWHCRESYVLAPPSLHVSGQRVQWIRSPQDYPLRDPMLLLPVLADACEEASAR